MGRQAAQVMVEAGNLDPGWTLVKFGDVVKLSNVRCSDPQAEGIERYVGLEHIDSNDLRIRRWGLVEDGITFTTRFKPGQVLFGKRRAYLRKVAIADFEGVCSGDIYVFESANPKELLPELLPFICQTERFFEYAIGTSAGSLSPRTNWKSLVNFEFALPLLEEQKRIFEKLSALEEAIELLLDADNTAEICRKSYLEKTFHSKTTKLLRLDEIAQIASGGTPSKSRQDFWEGKIPWLSPKDMKASIICDTENHISEKGLAAGSRLAPENSLFIVVRGMILAHTFPVCQSQVPMSFNQDVKAIIPFPKYTSDYVHAWLDWAAPRYLQLVSESSHGTKRLEQRQLLRLLIPDFDLDTQKQFLQPLIKIDAARTALARRIVGLRRLKAQILLLLGGST